MGGDIYITSISLAEGVTELTVPASFDDVPVVAIEKQAMAGNTIIEKLVIEDGVKSIGEKAFSECTALTGIDLPDSIQSIGFAAFFGDTALLHGDLPKTLKGALANSIFQNCTSMISANIPEGITSIGGWAFSGCSSLEAVYFNGVNQVKDIGRQAFYACSSLKEIYIPAAFQTISYDSFKNDTALTDVYFLGDVSATTFINWGSIKYSAFEGCSGITFHAFSETSKSLQDYVTEADSVDASAVEANPEAATYDFNFESMDDEYIIGEDGNAYSYTLDTDVNEVIIDGVLLIGSTDLLIPSELVMETEGGEELTAKVVEIGNKAFRGMGDTVRAEKPSHWYTDITSVVIPDGVTTIGTQAFYGCTSIVTIEIPDTVNTIRSGAFCYDTSLIELNLPEGLKGTIGDIFAWGNVSLEKVNIPDGITGIGRWAFYDCQNLKEIVIPAAVTSIDKEAFEQCYSLETVTFKEGSQCSMIGQQAFWNAKGLKTINLPESLTFIGVQAFRNCTSLEELTIPAGVTSFGIKAFGGCSNLSTVKIMGNVEFIDEDVFDSCSSLTDIWFYGNVSDIGFDRAALHEVNDVTFHAFKVYADSLEQYTAKYKESRGFDLEYIEGIFTDVIPGTVPQSAEKVVYWGTENGYIKGYSDQSFRPNQNCTRGETMIFLWRLAGKPAAKGSKIKFNDVSSTDSYYKAVQWAVSEGITKGYKNADGTYSFMPNEECQRIHVVTFMWRMAGKPSPSAKGKANAAKFTDVDTSSSTFKALAWAAEKNIVKGYSDGTFKPSETCTRLHIVTFMYRYAKYY